MSERAIELYKQAAAFAYETCKEEGRKGGGEDHIWLSLVMGKFAELLVQECAYTARQCYTVRGVDAEDVAQHIEATLLKNVD